MTNQTKQHIQQALQQFQRSSLRKSSLHLLATLGYQSDRQIELDNAPHAFLAQFNQSDGLRPDKAQVDDWLSADLLCQITDAEIRKADQLQLFDSGGMTINGAVIESYVFMAIALRGEQYTRTQLAQITREINKLFNMPVNLLFRHGQTLTIAIINRRLNKQDRSRDVLEKVTLIKDIRLANPHRAHVEILFDLSLDELFRVYSCGNFVALHQAWQKTLDSSELNKKFFNEVANWYFWAVNEVVFPAAAGPDETRNATSMIRLITRLIFVWFLKEKGVIPDDLFNERKLKSMLRWEDPQDSAYYKAILQNLFFATLNQEMNTPAKPDNRKFRGTRESGQSQHFMIHNVYRYEKYFRDPAAALALFADIPFLNGGLFECLDKRVDGQDVRIDGFSDRPDNPLRVPDDLFFGPERTIDLNETYGTSGKSYRVRGLIETLNRYKFTITENTPIEEEIALDPELLGKVFENLLAAYNPETGTTARKQTGSFYTPREIVNYMVDESLLAYLQTKASENLTGLKDLSGLEATDQDLTGFKNLSGLEERLRHLFAYNEEAPQFNAAEKALLIDAIDHVNILDPACGSGAFPMGILHKLVFILGKLDPDNAHWREVQRQKALAETEEAFRLGDRRQREELLLQINDVFERNASDYGRKLYLIENCIYGVDIQPVAVQIAKLRFFISLVVDQRLNDHAPNRGILPLPNLETKFVAANTLLGIEKPQQLALRNPAITAKEKELADVRSKHFRARTPQTKEKWRLEDKRLRAEIGALLQKDGFPNETTTKLAHWDPYNQNASADFFDMEWMFGLEDGFDVVIGNPPYVRQEKIKALKPALQKQYTCYTGVADLYVYFIEGGYRWLRERGVLCYICSNKYFRAGYGKKLRGYLSKQATIRQLIDFGDAPVFTAIAYPSIVLLQKQAPSENRLTAFNWEPGPPVTEFEPVFAANKFRMPQSALTADGWRLEQTEVLALLAKLRSAGKPLGEYVQGRFYRGILTGLNEAFVVDRVTRDRLIAEHPSSAELLKPFLRGRDVKRWCVESQDIWLIFTRRGIKIDNYPAIKNYLLQYKERLLPKPRKWEGSWSGRKAGSYEWYEVQDNIAYWQEFEQPKIIIPAIAQNAEYAIDTLQFYSNDKTSICIPDAIYYLCGLLNSSLLWWYIQQVAASRQGGFYEFKPMYVTEIPVALVKDKTPIESRVEKILALKQTDPTADVSALEREIDELVYALYNLTPAEIALIEGREPTEAEQVKPSPQTTEVRSNRSNRFSGSTAEAVTTNMSTPPLIFTGQPPQGSFSAKRARLETLTKQATPAAIQELTAALTDDNITIRWQASTALRTIGGPQVASTLQAFIHQTNNPAAKAEAEKLLAYIES